MTAIKVTFENRVTPIPSGKALFAAGIDAEGSVQSTMWKAFLKKNSIKGVPDSFKAVVSVVEEFLSKPIAVIASGKELLNTWQAPGPWE